MCTKQDRNYKLNGLLLEFTESIKNNCEFGKLPKLPIILPFPLVDLKELKY